MSLFQYLLYLSITYDLNHMSHYLIDNVTSYILHYPKSNKRKEKKKNLTKKNIKRKKSE